MTPPKDNEYLISIPGVVLCVVLLVLLMIAAAVVVKKRWYAGALFVLVFVISAAMVGVGGYWVLYQEQQMRYVGLALLALGAVLMLGVAVGIKRNVP